MTIRNAATIQMAATYHGLGNVAVMQVGLSPFHRLGAFAHPRTHVALGMGEGLVWGWASRAVPCVSLHTNSTMLRKHLIHTLLLVLHPCIRRHSGFLMLVDVSCVLGGGGSWVVAWWPMDLAMDRDRVRRRWFWFVPVSIAF